MGGQLSHQATWKKSVFEVYQDASIPFEWTPKLKDACDEVGIDYFSSPYDFEAIDMLDPYVPAYKIGSGDITWLEALGAHGAQRQTGAAGDRRFQYRRGAAGGAHHPGDQSAAGADAVQHQLHRQPGKLSSIIHLHVLKTYRSMFPELMLGLSDHTPGHATVLGAVTLWARAWSKNISPMTITAKARTMPLP